MRRFNNSEKTKKRFVDSQGKEKIEITEDFYRIFVNDYGEYDWK